MAPRTWFEELVDKYKNEPEYIARQLSGDLMEQVVRVMEKKGMNRSRLAEKMGVSKAYVTRLLSASPNLTLETLAALALALEAKPKVSLETSTDMVQNWFGSSAVPRGISIWSRSSYQRTLLYRAGILDVKDLRPMTFEGVLADGESDRTEKVQSATDLILTA